MGIGIYRHLVTFHHPPGPIDPPSWYCSVSSAGAQVVDGQASYMLRGRFHPGMTLETQVIFEGRTLQVQSLNDLDERHLELVVMAVEVRGRE